VLVVLLILAFIFLNLSGGTQFLVILVMYLLEIGLVFLNIDFIDLVWSTALFFPLPGFSLWVLRVRFLTRQLYTLKLPLRFWSSPLKFFCTCFLFLIICYSNLFVGLIKGCQPSWDVFTFSAELFFLLKKNKFALFCFKTC
jgi:hypothetical protein